MMTDKEFREKCREFSYQQMDDYFKDYQERDAFKSKEGIAIALLYIAANMPSVDNEEKKPCKFRKDIKSTEARVRITRKVTNGISDVDSEITIKYCPICSRKL